MVGIKKGRLHVAMASKAKIGQKSEPEGQQTQKKKKKKKGEGRGN